MSSGTSQIVAPSFLAMLMPYATSLAAATVIFVELFDPGYGLVNWFLTHVLQLPAVVDIPAYPVKVVDGTIQVGLPKE